MVERGQVQRIMGTIGKGLEGWYLRRAIACAASSSDTGKGAAWKGEKNNWLSIRGSLTR